MLARLRPNFWQTGLQCFLGTINKLFLYTSRARWNLNSTAPKNRHALYPSPAEGDGEELPGETWRIRRQRRHQPSNANHVGRTPQNARFASSPLTPMMAVLSNGEADGEDGSQGDEDKEGRSYLQWEEIRTRQEAMNEERIQIRANNDGWRTGNVIMASLANVSRKNKHRRSEKT